ncbi:MAG: DUF3592 domain-containing protein [Thermoplasmata archaeon]|nr:MAG: DUF3592 domain-containing protein [Thermoplasmata archaeon]
MEITEERDYDPETDYTDTYYTYIPKIEYSYTVNGVNYSGDKISFEIVSTTDYEWAQNKVDLYYKGKNVTVYYNPENPSESVLEKGFPGYPLFPTALCIIFIIIGLGFITYVIISIRKEKSPEKIEIKIKKTSYKPGEVIEGNVFLSFKKQIHGKSLKVSFNGEKIVGQSSRNGYQEVNFTFCKDEVVLDVEKDYFNESYPFRLKIPEDALQKAKDFDWREYGFVLNKQVKPSDRLSSLSKKASKILEYSQSPGFIHFNEYNQWYIEVVLETPKRFDIKSRKNINIHE